MFAIVLAACLTTPSPAPGDLDGLRRLVEAHPAGAKPP